MIQVLQIARDAIIKSADLIGNPPSNPTGFIPPSKFSETVANVFTILITIAAIAATFFIIRGGLDYVMSGGDASKVKTAQATLQYAVLGLVVAIAAFAILQLIKGALGIGQLELDLS